MKSQGDIGAFGAHTCNFPHLQIPTIADTIELQLYRSCRLQLRCVPRVCATDGYLAQQLAGPMAETAAHRRVVSLGLASESSALRL